MKSKSRSSSRCQTAAQTLLLGFAWLAAGPASGQNFLKNPDFELPLGPDNWTVVYTSVPTADGGVNAPTNCGPNDFMVAGRTTIAHKDLVPGTWDGEPYYWSKFGGHFAPNHTWMMHAYFKQVVTNLTPNAAYTVSAWMAMFTSNDSFLNKCKIYIEAVGGPNGAVSKIAPTTGNVLNCQNTPQNWQKYSVTNTATPSGQLEVRLHFNKFGTTAAWEWRNFNAFYDHASVIRTGTSPSQPAYKILSLARTNADLTLKWETVMNNKYRIQYAPSLADPIAWSWFTWSPYQDTKLMATGTNYTFKTNLAALFSYEPTFDLKAPRFFRIWSENFSP